MDDAQSIAPDSASHVESCGESSGWVKELTRSCRQIVDMIVPAQGFLDNYLHDRRFPIRAPLPRRL
eukprot:11263768-Heterocapsa_arctica.AAC.1